MKKGVAAILVDPKLKYTGRQYRVKARLIGLVSCDSLVLKINELGNSSLASQGGAWMCLGEPCRYYRRTLDLYFAIPAQEGATWTTVRDTTR